MPSISLPTINIPEEGLKSKETMENILDTLLKYRKELNFLLMNLDEDNMPTIENRIEDAEGNISEVTQTAGEIKLFVGNMEGDLAQLVINAGGITSYVTNTQGQVSTIRQEVDDITLFVGDMTGASSSLIIGAGGITSFVTDGNELATIINQTSNTVSILADKIDLTGITTLYDASNPDFYVRSGGRGLTFYDNGTAYLRLDYRDPSTARIYSDSALYIGDVGNSTYFEGDLNFSDNVDFTNADVQGVIVPYFSGNWFYLDYGGGDSVTVRNKSGSIEGYIDFRV